MPIVIRATEVQKESFSLMVDKKYCEGIGCKKCTEKGDAGLVHAAKLNEARKNGVQIVGVGVNECHPFTAGTTADDLAKRRQDVTCAKVVIVAD